MVAVRKVTKVFPGQGQHGPVAALHDLDLQVGRGELVSIVGPSGCGKSTLIDLVAGFTLPTSGLVAVNGRPVQGPGSDRVVVFQDHAVFPWYTALGNVAYGLRRQGVGRAEAEARALEALSQAGLGDFAHAFPAALSGGMRQRVALARALVMKPDILLLDEPFSSVDPATRARLQDELLALWQRHRWTVLFVTHAIAEAAYLADRVVLLDRPPTGVRCTAAVELERPRDRRDPRLAAFAERLTARMNDPGGGPSEECLCTRLPLELA